MGHNTQSVEAIKTLITQIEKLEEEKAALGEDVKAIYANAKAQGFDVKIMRKVIARRKLDAADRALQDELLDLYEAALEELR